MGILGDIGGLIGGIVGGGEANEGYRKALESEQRLYDEAGNLITKGYGTAQEQLARGYGTGKSEVEAGFDAAMDELRKTNPEAADAISQDPALRQAAMQSLAGTQAVAQAGGQDIQSRAAEDEALRRAAETARMGRLGATANLAARGQAGGGQELQAQLAAGQQESTAGALAGEQAAADARTRALQALASGGQQAQQMSAADTQRQAAQNQIAAFNAGQRAKQASSIANAAAQKGTGLANLSVGAGTGAAGLSTEQARNQANLKTGQAGLETGLLTGQGKQQAATTEGIAGSAGALGDEGLKAAGTAFGMPSFAEGGQVPDFSRNFADGGSVPDFASRSVPDYNARAADFGPAFRIKQPSPQDRARSLEQAGAMGDALKRLLAGSTDQQVPDSPLQSSATGPAALSSPWAGAAPLASGMALGGLARRAQRGASASVPPKGLSPRPTRSVPPRGMAALYGSADFTGGGHVPGRAEVAGDSSRNDTVDSKLSPGEVVERREVTARPGVKQMLLDMNADPDHAERMARIHRKMKKGRRG